VSVETARATEFEEAPKTGPSLLQSVIAAVVCPFDRVLAGMVGAGFGIAAICLYLDLTCAALDLSLARLGLRTPHDRPLRKQSAKAWTIIDTRRLILWRQTGIHPDVIGVRLNRSANAVRGKARRLGIPAPDRGTLRRVDPWSLPDPIPGFGFPVPSSADFCEPAAREQPAAAAKAAHPQPAAEDTRQRGRPANDAPAAPTRSKRRRKETVQRELALLSVVAKVEPLAAPAPLSEPEQADSSPIGDLVVPDKIGTESDLASEPDIAASTKAKEASRATFATTQPANSPSYELLPAVPRPALASKPEDATPEEGDLTWIGKLQHVIYDEEAVRIIGMRQMGLEHWRSTAAVLGLTPGQLKTIRTRIDIPVDRDRSKFGSTYDPELARFNFDTCGYTLMRERTIPSTGRPGHWFYRRNGSKDWFSLWTQLHVNKTIDKRTYDFSRLPVDLQMSVHSQPLLKESLQFLRGSADEERACRGHAPPVRSGLPGRPGNEMPWTYPGAGSVARGVAYT
jgi:hypothetical protein